MNDKNIKELENTEFENVNETADNEEQLSLNDDRRVKVLSPTAMVVKRFFRNRLAVLGLIMLVSMFIFSFIGGLISPYGQDEQFYRYENQMKDYLGIVENYEFRYLSADGQKFDSVLQAKFQLAYQKKQTSFEYKNVTYDITEEGTDFYSVHSNGTMLAMAFKDIVNNDGAELTFTEKYEALKAYTAGQNAFTADGKNYTIDEAHEILLDGQKVGFISRLVISPVENGVVVSPELKVKLEEAIAAKVDEFTFTEPGGEEETYKLSYDAATYNWTVKKGKETYVYDAYTPPSKEHLLGTDKNGMDMLTRLMYGGRVSLIIGFIVVFIEVVIGVTLGGLAGYFGKWVDMLIMRIVDIFYCIPSMPLIIILGAAMDAMKVEPMTRMFYLMLILGFLGWPGITRLVRGQILSLREQEFMTATEACGIRVSRRIFKHLIPNVIPQLIVSATMSLGSTIIMEATLSFLGIGVKFPFASWGNIITDVNDAYVMTHYWFVWIPAGICLLIAVLGFNFVGDGLRDAFDPKMKR